MCRGKEPLLQNTTLLELQGSDPEFASQLSTFIQDIAGAIIEEITHAEDRQSAFAKYANLRQRNLELETLLSNCRQHSLEHEKLQSNLRQRNVDLENLLSNLRGRNLELEELVTSQSKEPAQPARDVHKISTCEERHRGDSCGTQEQRELEELVSNQSEEPAKPSADVHTISTYEEGYRRIGFGTQAQDTMELERIVLDLEAKCRYLHQQLKDAVSGAAWKDNRIAILESLLAGHACGLTTPDRENQDLQHNLQNVSTQPWRLSRTNSHLPQKQFQRRVQL